MEHLKHELLLLRAKLQSLVQIGGECKNLITFSEGFVKRDLSLIRLNFEIKLRKLEEQHVNELKTMAKEEKDTIDWEVKCIQDETKRLEKSAADFQTSADKQKARVFQDEVKFLQKIIEKASKKFRRKKLKFDVNKNVKKFFDSIDGIGRIEKEIVDINIGESNRNADLSEAESHRIANFSEAENNKIRDLSAGEGKKLVDVSIGQIKSTNKLTANVEISNGDDWPARKPRCDSQVTTESNQTDKLIGDTTCNTNNNKVENQLHTHFAENLHLNKRARSDKGNNYLENNALNDKLNNEYSVGNGIKHVENLTMKDSGTAAETLNPRNNHENSKLIVEDKDRITPSGNIVNFSDEPKESLPLTESDWVKFRDQELHKNNFSPTARDKNSKQSFEIPNMAKDDNDRHKHKPDRISVLQELCKRLDSQNNSKILDKNNSGKILETENNGKMLDTKNNDKILDTRISGKISDAMNNYTALDVHNHSKKLDTQSIRSPLERIKQGSNNVKCVKSKAVGTDDDMLSIGVSDRSIVSDRLMFPRRNTAPSSPRSEQILGRNETANRCNSSHDDSNINLQCSDDLSVFNKPKGIIKNWTNDKNNLRRSKSDSSKYSYLRNKKYVAAKKENLHVKFADVIDQFEDMDNEMLNDTDDGINQIDLGKEPLHEPGDNARKGYQDTCRDPSSNTEVDDLQVHNITEKSFNRTVSKKMRKADPEMMSPVDYAQGNPVARENAQENSLLQKFKTALDNFRESGVVNSNNDVSSHLLTNELDRGNQALQESKSKQTDQIEISTVKLDSDSPKARTNTFGGEEFKNISALTEKPKSDMFDLNNFRNTIENLKEEIITTRRKHGKDSTATLVEDNKQFKDKAVIKMAGAVFSDSDAFINKIDSKSSAMKDQQDMNYFAIDDHQDCESPSIVGHPILKLSLPTGQQEGEHLAITNQEYRETLVNKNNVTDYVTDHVTDHVDDFKAPGMRSPRQTNGLKVSNARIAAYVRRRLKAIELLPQFPATSLLTSSLTGPVSEELSETSPLTSSLTCPSSNDSSNKGSAEDCVNSNSENDIISKAVSHSGQQMRPNIKDIVLKHSRTNKQRLPSSKEMLFDS